MLPQFLIGTTVILLTEPMSLGSGVSLFSKKLNPEVQGIIIMLHDCVAQYQQHYRTGSWCEEISGVSR